MKAVISIIGTETDRYTKCGEENENYSHLKWSHIREMMDSGLVEFQNHTYNMHKLKGDRKGTSKNPDETEGEYQAALAADIGELQRRFQEMTGYTPKAFTYPFGRISPESYSVLVAMGFQATLDCQGKIFYVRQGDERCLYRIPRYCRQHGKSAQKILESLFTC